MSYRGRPSKVYYPYGESSICLLPFGLLRSFFSCRAQGYPRVGGANGFNRRSGGVNRSLQQSENDMKCWTSTLDSNVDES